MIRVFVSSPYSHQEPIIMAERARIAGDAAAWLWRDGYAAYSPIAHWHEIAIRNGLPTNANSWIELNRRELAMSDAVAFLHLPGWRDSAGMAMEREWAKDMPKASIEPRGGVFVVTNGALPVDTRGGVWKYQESQCRKDTQSPQASQRREDTQESQASQRKQDTQGW